MPRTKPCVGNSSPHANNTSSSTSTSSSSSPKSAIPGEYADPGLRSTTTTTLFRAVNPELFIRPNKYIMAFGLLTISGCVAYIAYLHATEENKMYSASEDHSIARAPAKKSKWD